MIPDNYSILLLKVGEYRWMERIKDGQLSIGTLGSFIQIAKMNDNQEQGITYSSTSHYSSISCYKTLND